MMTVSIPDKSYFRIGEVSRLLGVQSYVIRYWETEFKTVKPIRTRSDQRLYRHKDVEELLMIRKLLYEENFTINGARKQLHKLRGEEPTASGRERRDALLDEIEQGLRWIREIVR
ncbi:MAG: MerR family transcriptional regulator [Syntrophales bacterium]|nr:MerR family transcriptional regulator [Syntrophales bacterium]